MSVKLENLLDAPPLADLDDGMRSVRTRRSKTTQSTKWWDHIVLWRRISGPRRVLASLRDHPSIWIAALLTPLFIYIGVEIDRELGESLSAFPVSANILATFLSIPLAFFVGALIFERTQAKADKRLQHRVEEEVKSVEIFKVFLPRLITVRTKLRENPLIRNDEKTIMELDRPLSTLEQIIRQNPTGETLLPNAQIPSDELRELHACIAALPSIRDAIGSLDDSLLAVGVLIDSDELWEMIEHVMTEIEQCKQIIPSPRLDNVANNLNNMLNEESATWNGSWVARESSGYSFRLSELRQVTSVAKQSAAAVTQLENSLKEIESFVRKSIRKSS